jgi:hypothetical protein
MANANAMRDWRIYADFAQHLIGIARELYIDEALPGLEGLDTVYALRRSTCVCRSFHGRHSVQPKPPSSCTRYWICAATFRRLSSSATAKCMTSESSIIWCPNRALSMSWIEAMSISNAWGGSMMPEVSSLRARSRI